LRAYRNSRWVSYLIGLVLISLSCLVSVVVLEVILRAWRPEHLKLFPRYHEAVRYGEYTLRRTRPGSEFVHTSMDGRWRFKVDRNGFRSDYDISRERKAGVARILVLGDSQAFGYENHHADTLPLRLEAELRSAGVEAEAINSGVSGFGTAEQLIFLENYGLSFQPDMVVLMFFKNDYSDNVRSGLFHLHDDELRDGVMAYAPGTAILYYINDFASLRWLSENSYLYSFVFNTVWNTAKSISYAKAEGPSLEIAAGVGVPPQHQKALTAALISRLAAQLAERSIPLAIIDIPDIAADGDLRQFVTSITPDQTEFFARNSTVFIGSEEALGEFRGQREFHRRHGDRHVTALVHHQYAKVLAPRLAPLLRERLQGVRPEAPPPQSLSR
jgi:hypothetical protein